MRGMNPESEWKEVTCEGPFAEELPAQTLSYFRNRQGETTLERPAEGVCSSTVERDPDSFVKQYPLLPTMPTTSRSLDQVLCWNLVLF